tara:strand:- start:2493 stop:3758 length:1266 start_codon:yes stop_codon:yes gene_type:complete
MPHNSNGIDWNKYKNEILDLHSKGNGSSSIVDILEDSYGKFPSKNPSRQIRKIIARAKPDELRVESKTSPNDYGTPFVLSAWDDDGTIMDIDRYCQHHGLPREDITSYKLIAHTKTPFWNVVFREVKADVIDPNLAREEMIEDLKQYSPTYKTYYRAKPEDGHLLIINPADCHINKLALDSETRDPYDIDIAVERIISGVEGVINKSSGFDIDKILLVIGNDILNTDTTTKTTTNGTPQDNDTSWSEAFKIARRVYVEVLEMCLAVADVHVMHTPDNHSLMSGFMLADSLYAWFHNSDNVTWDIDNKHRKYWSYGNSLIGITHGDGAKMDNLPLLMANEAKNDWADSDFRYFLLGHLHHYKSIKFQDGKDYHGVTVDYMRSPSGSDWWHSTKGFQHSKKAIEGFIHSKTEGRVAKLIHLFK